MIRPLTSLRFFFALMVFVSHLGFVHPQAPWFAQVYAQVFKEGYIGVSFFFILSGFILAYTYQQRMHTGEVSPRQFWVARFARIYPLFFLTLLLAIPLSMREFLQDAGYWAGRLLCNVSLTHAFVPSQDFFFSFNAPSWSISDEAFFYALFPGLVWLLGRSTGRWLWWGILALVPLGMLVMPAFLHHPLFYINPVFRVADFLLGILLFECFQAGRGQQWFRSPAWATACEAAATGLFVLFFVLHPLIGQVWRYSVYYWIPMAVIIYVFAHQKGALSRVLSAPLLVLGGEISFGLYLIHQLVMRYYVSLSQRAGVDLPPWLVVLLVLGITLLASYLSYRWVEKPCNRYIKKRF